WPQAGEIVGFGFLSIPAWTDVVHQDFLASPAHRAIMLNGAFTQVGVAVAYRSGKTWVTEIYARAGGAGPAPPPVPAAPRVSRTRTVIIVPRPRPVVARSAPARTAPPAPPPPVP